MTDLLLGIRWKRCSSVRTDSFPEACEKERLILISLVGDIYKDLTSEIRWEDVDDNEKFYFENPNGCMIFNNGEMTLVEYGLHKPLGTFRFVGFALLD